MLCRMCCSCRRCVACVAVVRGGRGGNGGHRGHSVRTSAPAVLDSNCATLRGEKGEIAKEETPKKDEVFLAF